MTKRSKRYRELVKDLDNSKFYNLDDAVKVLSGLATAKFEETVDMIVNLGIDPKKTEQQVRGVASLPNGTGKKMKVLALVTSEKEDEAKEAKADFIGLDEYIKKIKEGWLDFDVIVTMPSVMSKIGALGRVLGPRGLMPNPKIGTVTMDIKKSITEIKKGKIDFKTDKDGTIHSIIGKKSFKDTHLKENGKELLDSIIKLKPSTLKGKYIKSIFVKTTMGPSIKIDCKDYI